MRINKYIATVGICSRRKADELLKQGRVIVNGKVAKPGLLITEKDEVSLDGKILKLKEEKVYIKYHKPVGVICSSDRNAKDNIIDALKLPYRIFPIGRLDVQSSGLILLTTDGELANRIMHPSFEHEKEYEVVVDKLITKVFLSEMSSGVRILGKKTQPCVLKQKGDKKFIIILKEGMNRQIRRMCDALGYEALSIKRIRVLNIALEGLRIGEFKFLTKNELNEILKLTKLCSNANNISKEGI